MFGRALHGDIRPFPDDFLFGVATADHQCEAHGPPWPDDIWDVWERERELQPRRTAARFWELFEEDIERAQKLGCQVFRFSVAWSRVEPEPGRYDDDAFDHYRQVVLAIRQAGMQAMVTLCHFTWPLHVEQHAGPLRPTDRGLIADDFPATFERYATEVARRLGPEVEYWLTFNEPNQLVYGYIKPVWDAHYHVPPGVDAQPPEQVARVARLMRNLFLANAAARKAIKAVNPHARVGANPLMLGLPRWLQDHVNQNAACGHKSPPPTESGSDFPKKPLGEWGAPQVVVGAIGGIILSVLIDLILHQTRHLPRGVIGGPPPLKVDTRRVSLLGIVADLVRHPRQNSILLTVCLSNWWQLGMAGQLPAYLCPPECVGQQDFTAFDYYWGVSRWRVDLLMQLYDAMMGRYDQAPVYPQALADLLHQHARWFPGLPIVIAENGCVDQANEWSRSDYIREHLYQVQLATHAGLPVQAYVCWSITSNREWGLPFGPGSDFGLYHVNLDGDPALARESTPAADLYQAIIARRHVHRQPRRAQPQPDDGAVEENIQDPVG